jgi:3-deoxy-7-phosphoheptulonate synthase
LKYFLNIFNNLDIYKYVKGLMIESYLVDGSQHQDEGVYGKSITDPCLGWEKTEKLVLELAEIRKNHRHDN